MRNDYDRDETSATTKLTYLLIGGGIGAVIALLFAPKSGVELARRYCGCHPQRASKRDARRPPSFRKKRVSTTRCRASRRGELYQTAQEKAGAIKERARSAAAQSVNPFTAAVEAGKDAYVAEKRKTESKAITEGRPTYPVESKEENN